MKIIKIVTPVLLITFFASLSTVNIQAQETSDTGTNISAEFAIDEIDADSLNVDEPDALPGQFRYNWQILKENVGLFFTFNKEKKLAKLEEISSRRILEAKQLSFLGTENAANRMEEALARYNDVRAKIAQRLEENPELKEKILEKLDANQLKHQQILSSLTEKLKDKFPEEKLQQLENIRTINIRRWYNLRQEKIQSRLEKAVDNNNVGSKFKQLQNIAVLEDLAEKLPNEAKEKVEAAKIRAEEKLATRLENFEDSDREKIESYIDKIEIPEMVKYKFINNLKDSEELPQAIRERAANIYEKYAAHIQDRFANMSEEEQEKFLEQFQEKLDANPAYLKILKNLDSEINRDRIQNALEIQNQRIKEAIQNTTDPARLRAMEQNIQDDPVLRRQIQDQKRQIQAAPSPIRYNTDIVPQTTQ